MQLPFVRGVIDRRILINFRVDEDILIKHLPAPFRPKLIDGTGMAGICLIRLRQIRPQYFASWFGFSSENAAHRIAVEWDHGNEKREGVFVPRRDTSSRLNTYLGGMFFPGEQHHAHFQTREQNGQYQITIDSDDRETHLHVEGHSTDALPHESIFPSLQQASEFFERGSVGYSVTHQPGRFDGLELRSQQWQVSPLAIDRVESSYFDDRTCFPAGSVQFDCALLMQNIEHEWHGREPIVCSVC